MALLFTYKNKRYSNFIKILGLIILWYNKKVLENFKKRLFKVKGINILVFILKVLIIFTNYAIFYRLLCQYIIYILVKPLFRRIFLRLIKALSKAGI